MWLADRAAWEANEAAEAEREQQVADLMEVLERSRS